MVTGMMRMKSSHATAFLRITLILGLMIPWAFSLSASAKTYNYFAIGSNMLPTTMTALRGIRPLNASAAILPDYQLAFNIAGSPYIEPSAASARPAVGDCLHGVLYELSESDFARVGSTEGIPFVYRWEPCQVIPYTGNNESAGRQAMLAQEEKENESKSPASSVLAYTLTSTSPNTPTFIPTSSSYLRILQQGAAYWKMDRDYQIQLSQTTTAKNLIVRDGLSGNLLQAAELGVKVRKDLSERLIQLAKLVDPPTLD
jgi:hypothetical protein